MPVVTSSVMASIDGAKDSAVNIIGLDFSVVTATGAEDNENYLNHLTLIEGQFPAEGYKDEDGNEVPLSSQVVAERSNNYFAEVKPGDKIVIADNLNTANSTYGDIYAQKELTVVGVVSSPDYYYVDAREITTVGTGVVNLVVYGNYNPEDEENSVYDLSKEGTVFATLNADSFKVGPISVPVDPIRADKIIYTDLWVRIDGMENYEYFYDNDFVTGQAEFIAQLGGRNKRSGQYCHRRLHIKAQRHACGHSSCGCHRTAGSACGRVLVVRSGPRKHQRKLCQLRHER